MTDAKTTESKLLDLIFDHRAIEFTELSRVFNPLRVLGVEHYEIRHANTLAWLLTPGESHGLGDAFARQFLKIACDQDTGGIGTATLSAIASTGLEAAHVRREISSRQMEWLTESEADDAIEGKPEGSDVAHGERERPGLLDVLIQGENWVVAIEAKVRSRQHSDQLDRYARSLAKGASSMHRLHIFLTNDLMDEPPEPWRPITWDTLVSAPLHLILDRLPNARLGEPQIAFLRSFLDVVDEHCLPPKGRREYLLAALVKDYALLLNGIQGRRKGGRLSERERELVAQNADLIKKLTQRFRAPNVLREPMIKGLIEADERLVLAAGAKGYIRFVMKDWLLHPWVHGASRGKQNVDYGVICEIENNRDLGVQFKLQIRFLAGDDEHQTQRAKLLELVIAAAKAQSELAQRFPRATHKPDKYYFTIYSTEFLPPPLADDPTAVAAILHGDFMRSAEALSAFVARV